MMQSNFLSAGREDGPTRLPVLMTAFVWPGIGQFMQQRRLPAVVFTLGFLASATFFFVYAFRIMKAYYSLWLDFNTYQAPPMPWRSLLVSFLIGMLLYVGSVLDAYLGYIRQRSQWNQKKNRMPPSVPGTTSSA